MLQGEHSAILSTFIKLPFSIKTFVLSIFKWLLKTGFTVKENLWVQLTEVVVDLSGAALQTVRLSSGRNLWHWMLFVLTKPELPVNI